MSGVRARARAALLDDVSTVARAHLAERGASELSIRAISRELGLAPSALYRYYPSRDALLTQLIIQAYDELGDHVERAAAEADPAGARARFVAAALAIRSWALEHRHEYALIYGSPVPGYAAPDDTIGPATRVIAVLVETMRHADPASLPDAVRHPLRGELDEQVAGVIERAGGDLDPHVVAYGAIQWATFFGLVNFELFGTFTSSFDDAGDLYRHAVEIAADTLGIPNSPR